MDVQTAFRVFSNKGPVNHESSQRAAWNAYRDLMPYLMPEERSKLSTAHGHATITGEGRWEFDMVCKEIKERLIRDGVL